ncbi:methyltransferase [Rhizobium leguminosarum]|uniref:methyltransferase n=1 Tax=Rhizobium leguminosarum TaxID=384 RepID=UPI001C90D05B|nr:methyltransferase [Rhizobium leguminosarum]MBY2988677.1 methyltransferase [Rhizobium leguminosarum]
MPVLEDATFSTSASSSAVDERRELDRFYTPDELADQLIAFATAPFVSVADFAAGTGNLLAAAMRRWPRVALYANDVDPIALDQTRHRLPCVRTHHFDFLSSEFHSLHARSGDKWELIVLNPPFSQREMPVHIPVGRHSGLRCSRSMAFVMTAVQYLAPGGQLLAILPTSTLSNRIDGAARDVLRSKYSVEVVRAPAYGLFEGADVSTYFLRISDGSLRSLPVVRGKGDVQPWKITRGSISVARASRRSAGAVGWVHTTGLNRGIISHRYAFPGPAYGKIAPFGSVLLPRVGRFGSDKIAVVERDEGEHVSDCVFAIQHSELEPAAVMDLLKLNFVVLSSLYGGTGAPYITQDRLKAFLAEVL